MRGTRRYGVVAVLTLHVCSLRRYQWPMLDPRHCLSNKPFLLTIFSKQEYKKDCWYCGGSHIGLDCCGWWEKNWINLGSTFIKINNWDFTENIREGVTICMSKVQTYAKFDQFPTNLQRLGRYCNRRKRKFLEHFGNFKEQKNLLVLTKFLKKLNQRYKWEDS